MVEVFFNDTATSEIYTLSLHDALPIFEQVAGIEVGLAAELLDALGDAVSVLALGIGVLFEFAGNRFAVHAGGHKVVVHVAEDAHDLSSQGLVQNFDGLFFIAAVGLCDSSI